MLFIAKSVSADKPQKATAGRLSVTSFSCEAIITIQCILQHALRVETPKNGATLLTLGSTDGSEELYKRRNSSSLLQ